MRYATNSAPISNTASIVGLSLSFSGKWFCMLVSRNSLAKLFIREFYGPNIDSDQLMLQIHLTCYQVPRGKQAKGIQRMLRPPSNIRVWPVTNAVDADASSLMNDAVSFIVVIRFSGVPSITWAI